MIVKARGSGELAPPGSPIADGRRRGPHWRRRLAAGVLALLVSGCLSACATIDADDLSGYVDQLHSDAAEAALLAGQEAAARIPYIFVWLHSAELSHQVQELRDHLDGEVAARGVDAKVKLAKRLTEAVGETLGGLHHNANGRAQAAQAEVAFKRQARQAEALYEELQ